MKKNLIYLGILLFLVSCNQEVNSDTTQDNSTNSEVTSNINYEEILNQAKEEHQKKLDTGIGMLQASKSHNYVTDSLMTLVYKELLAKTSEADQEKLVLEQKEWLASRKKEFDLEYKKGEKIFNETGIFPQLEEMVAYGVSSDLNYERAVSLSKQLEGIK